MNWSTQKASEFERILSTDVKNCLTSKIAALRLKEEGKNFLDRSLDVTPASSLQSAFFDAAHLPILCAIVMSFSYVSFFFGLLAFLIWGLFMVLYCFFHWRAKRRIARAAMMSIPPVRILRDGKIGNIQPHLLVRGDVFFLEEGDTVPCDAYILEADDLKVYEAKAFVGGGQAYKNAQVTDAGEKAYAAMHNMLFATSDILCGTCKAVCTASGRYTLAVRENRVSSMYGGTTPDFVRKIKKRISPILYLLTILCLEILVLGFVYGKQNVFHAFFASAACISSLLFACADGMATIGYSLSLDHLRRKKHARVLLKNPLLPDLLPQLDCIFIDTQLMFDADSLAVRSIHTAWKRYRADEIDSMKNDGVDRLLAYAAALDACVVAESNTDGAARSFSTSSEKSAMCRFYAKNGAIASLDLKTISFRPSENGFYYDSVLLSDEDGGMIVSSGDALTLLRSCTNLQNGERKEPLSESLRTKIIDEISLLRQQGRRVIAYAAIRSEEQSTPHSPLMPRSMTLLFYVAFHKRESGSIEKFFDQCAKRKLEPIVFHEGSVESARLLIGEHPLLQNARICDGRQIPSSCSDYAALIDSYEIFACFSSEQKQRLFRELIDRKFKVGILARSNEDIPLLKDAHVVFLQTSSNDAFVKMTNEPSNFEKKNRLMKESDVLVDSSINAISDAVEAAYDYKRNLLASFTYLTGMISLRILLCLIGALYGFSMVSLLGLLIFNFLFDALIVFHLLFGSLKKDAIPLTFIPNLRHALKRSLNFFMPILILPACLAVAFPLLAHYVQGFGYGAMSLAVLWILTVLPILYARLGFSIRFLSLTKKRILPILLLVSLFSALPFISTLFGVSFHWISPLITILSVALFALLQTLSVRRENKYKQ